MLKNVKVIAELGNTHEGSVGLAKCMIAAAAHSGADIVKLQTHIFEAESLANAPNPPYFSDETRKHYFERTAFNKEQYLDLIQYSKSLGVDLISSPFSVEAFDFLCDIGLTKIKIPSGEVNNEFLLQAISKKQNLEIILSSGMSTLDELDRALDIISSEASHKITLLQCTSEYPCPLEDVGLEKINEFKERYNVPVGFSDHTLSEAVPALAVYAGATIIEKHFTLSKLAYGSDARNSLEPSEFKKMVEFIREAEAIMGSQVNKDSQTDYIKNMKTTFEKSLVYRSNLPEGHQLTYEDFAGKKPGNGLPTRDVYKFIGERLKANVQVDQLVSEKDI